MQCNLVGKNEGRNSLLAKESIDVIDDEYRNSSLTLEDYYTFYGFVNGMYNADYQKEMDEFIHKHCLEEYRNIPIVRLELVVQIVIRMFITIKKQATMLLLYDFEGSINQCEIGTTEEKLKSHCIKSKKACMIVTNNRQESDFDEGVLLYINK